MTVEVALTEAAHTAKVQCQRPGQFPAAVDINLPQLQQGLPTDTTFLTNSTLRTNTVWPQLLSRRGAPLPRDLG